MHVLVEALALLPATQRRGLEVDVRGAATSAQHPGYGKALERRVRGAILPLEFRGPFDPSELPRVLSGLDVIAIPSLWLENLPLVLLQARAAGIPVVASAVGGIAPFVREGDDALLFPPGDAPALSRCPRRPARRRDPAAHLRARPPRPASADYAAQVARFAAEDDDEG
ncbi:MAG: glycosyltransferase [Planctomycetota bacterium]